jgi:hypothetical protein
MNFRLFALEENVYLDRTAYDVTSANTADVGDPFVGDEIDVFVRYELGSGFLGNEQWFWFRREGGDRVCSTVHLDICHMTVVYILDCMCEGVRNMIMQTKCTTWGEVNSTEAISVPINPLSTAVHAKQVPECNCVGLIT